jgi:hypothetical protein
MRRHPRRGQGHRGRAANEGDRGALALCRSTNGRLEIENDRGVVEQGKKALRGIERPQFRLIASRQPPREIPDATSQGRLIR